MKIIDWTADWIADHFDDLKANLKDVSNGLEPALGKMREFGRSERASAVAGIAIGASTAAVALALVWPAHRHVVPSAVQAAAQSALVHVVPGGVLHSADFAGQAVTDDARQVAEWVAESRDNRSMTFAILDKRAAQLFVFDANAKLVGASRVLLGAAPGDDSVPGIGQRPMDQVRPEEKTTPAGRFVSHPGRNSGGEEVIWVDYDAAVSMHRVRIVDPKERRLERLARGEASDRRISYGCINIPVAFFDAVMKPKLGATSGVVYVLPESKSLAEVFPAFAAAARREV